MNDSANNNKTIQTREPESHTHICENCGQELEHNDERESCEEFKEQITESCRQMDTWE